MGTTSQLDFPTVRVANPSHPPGAGSRSRPPPARTLVQDGIRGLIPSQGLFGEMLVALGKALHFSQTGVQCHGRVTGVLGHVEVRSPPQLLLDHQGLLQQLGGTGGEGFRTSPCSSVNRYRSTSSSCPGGSHQQSLCPALLPTSLAPRNSWGNRLSPYVFLSRSDTEHPEGDLGSISTASHMSGAGRAPSLACSQRAAQGSQPHPVHSAAEPTSSPGPSPGCLLSSSKHEPLTKPMTAPCSAPRRRWRAPRQLWGAALVPPTR